MSFHALTVEIAFDSTFNTPAVSRTWTDVSAYVEAQYGVTINRGRADVFSDCAPSTCSLTLNNRDGRFTAGKSSSPYYPNVKIGRPIRVTATPVGGSGSVRFVGYVDEWPLEWPDGTNADAVAQISATSRTGRLGLSTVLDGTETIELLADDPEALYLFEDPDGATSAADSSPNIVPPLVSVGTGEPVGFGGQGEDGRPMGAAFVGGQYLKATLSTLSVWTFEVEFATTSAALMCIAEPVTNTGVTISGGTVTFDGTTLGTNLHDGERHTVAVSRDASSNLTMYLDGTQVATDTSSAALGPVVSVGATATGARLFVGSVSKFAVYATELTSTRVGVHHDAASGFAGESTATRLERYAGYAGIPSAEVSAAASAVTMGVVDTQGLSIVDALRVVESTEGGVLFDGRDGSLTLQGRGHRYQATVGLTLSIADQQIEAGFSPKLDRSALKNDITATDSGVNIGSVVTARALDQASIDEYGEHSGSVTIASDNENEARAAADWLVYLYAEPSSKVPSLGVDLTPLELATQEDVLAADIGTRIQVTGQPSQAAASSADFFVEGYSESITATTYDFQFQVSPAHAVYDSIFTIDDPVLGLLDAGNIIGF